MTLNRLFWKIKEKAAEFLLQIPRILFYRLLSNIQVNAKKYQPVLANGEGQIRIGNNVNFGVRYSKDCYTRYCYINARRKESVIEIGDNTWINNNITIISDGKKISIGKDCLIGTDVEIMDSDFHDLEPRHRFGGKNILKGDVTIEDNVFIGNGVVILKGVTIGKNSVIGNRSVVVKNIPANVIAAGNPAKVIKQL